MIALYCRFIGWKSKDMEKDRARELYLDISDELKVHGEGCFSLFTDTYNNYLGFGVDTQYFYEDELKTVDHQDDWRPTEKEIRKMLDDLPLTAEEKLTITTYQYICSI